MDQEVSKGSKAEVQLKGGGGEFGWFWGVATGVVAAYPCGLPLSAPRGQGGLPPTTVIRCTKGESAASVRERVCVHTR